MGKRNARLRPVVRSWVASTKYDADGRFAERRATPIGLSPTSIGCRSQSGGPKLTQPGLQQAKRRLQFFVAHTERYGGFWQGDDCRFISQHCLQHCELSHELFGCGHQRNRPGEAA